MAIVICSGCSTLTRSQLNEVNAFGKVTSGFSAYPGTIVSTYIHIHQQSEIYRANSLPVAGDHMEAVVKASKFVETTGPVPEKIDLSLKIIDQYAQALILLTSNKHQLLLDTAAVKFGTNLEGLIDTYNKADPNAKLPTGIGSIAASAVTLAGGVYIRSKQAEDIKKVVPIGDQIIEKLTDNLLKFLGPEKGPYNDIHSLPYLMDQERNTLKNNYSMYLGLNRDDIMIGKDDIQYKGVIKHERFGSLRDDQNFMQALIDLDNAEILRIQCIDAITALRKAHTKLLQDIREKITLTQYAIELQNYSSDVQNVYNTVKAIK